MSANGIYKILINGGGEKSRHANQKAITLNWLLPKDQFKSVIIVDSGSHLAKAQAML